MANKDQKNKPVDKKKVGIIAGIVAVALVIGLAIGGIFKPAPAPQPTPAPTPAPAPVKPVEPEEHTCTGTFKHGEIYDITVEGPTGDMNFDTTNAEFIYGSQGVLTVGDTVTVTYTVDKDNKNVAERVVVDNEVPIVCTEKGIVSDLHDKEVVVVSEKDTNKFAKDDKTVIEGNLSVGDEVEVTYNYSQDENFYATKIKVTSENKDPRQQVCIGTVNEVKDNVVKVAINKNVAYSFKLTAATKVTGKSDKIAAGQSVAITYMGHPEESPEAISVEITALPAPKPTPA
ncbi:MAG: hypothetical protein KBS83_05705, partial [Lachnospiraceae bacterium]|nr:hypothetical protein [Candidatus Equihabitans merdae]